MKLIHKVLATSYYTLTKDCLDEKMNQQWLKKWHDHKNK